MDPFQIRLTFISALDKLNASQPSIQKALNFIVTYSTPLSSELWSCIMDEFFKASLNRRINLLFLIDSIFTDDTISPGIRALFRPYLERDLAVLFDLTVPEGRWDGTLNIPTVRKILANWKSKFVLDRSVLSDLELMLTTREASLHALSPTKRDLTNLTTTDMVRRMEEDRERHKRLRERAWILPPTSFSHTTLFGIRPEQLNPTFLSRTQKVSEHDKQTDPDGDRIWTAQDLDFSQLWDETSDFNEDDVEAIDEQDRLGWAKGYNSTTATATTS